MFQKTDTKNNYQFNVLEHIFMSLVLLKWTAESTKSFTGKCLLAVPSLKTAISVQIFPQIICNFINEPLTRSLCKCQPNRNLTVMKHIMACAKKQKNR